VRVDDAAARLVQKVPAAIRYLLVDRVDFAPLLGSVLGALPLARKLALLALEPLLGLLERTNGLGDSPIGRGQVVLETQIEPRKRRVSHGNIGDVARDGDVPFAGRVPDHCRRLRGPLYRSVVAELDVADLRESDLAAAPDDLKGRGLRIGEGSVPTTSFEARVPAASEESSERLVQPKQDVLQDLRVYARVTLRALLELWQRSLLFVHGDRAFLSLVGVPSFGQSEVVELAQGFEPLFHFRFLRRGRVEPVAVGEPHTMIIRTEATSPRREICSANGSHRWASKTLLREDRGDRRRHEAT
jgi:hypothetical protein